MNTMNIPDTIPSSIRHELEDIYNADSIQAVWEKAWQLQNEDLRRVSPAIKPAVLILRSHYRKESPTCIQGRAQISGSDEDWFLVWNG